MRRSFSVQKLQLFQGQMEEVDVRLVEAEQVKSNWTPVQDLVIDSLSEQMDDLKVSTLTVLVTQMQSLICFYIFLPLFFKYSRTSRKRTPWCQKEEKRRGVRLWEVNNVVFLCTVNFLKADTTVRRTPV